MTKRECSTFTPVLPFVLSRFRAFALLFEG